MAMKVYTHEQGITLVGKAWEIVQKLKEYNKDYVLVSEWAQDVLRKK
jgi:hypothetical protein